MENQVELYDRMNPNPLDSVEAVLSDHNWVYSRMNDAQLVVDVAGKSCNYRLLFVWQEHMNSLQLCCEYDLKIKELHLPLAAMALMDMNASLWMGHFELDRASLSPSFRQTCFIREHDQKRGYAHIEDLVDISLIQCERYQSVFALLTGEGDGVIDADIISFAMMETAGES